MKYRNQIIYRILITCILIILQFGWFPLSLFRLVPYTEWINLGLYLFSLIIFIYIISKEENPSYKIGWILIMIPFPLLGGFLFLTFGDKRPSSKFRLKLEQTRKKIREDILSCKDHTNEKRITDDRVDGTFRYVERNSGYQVYNNTKVTYYPIGEKMFEDIMSALRTAEHFVFLEFFIIEEGRMWNQILDLLVKKAKQGVDIRIIYDDMACLKLLPTGYYKQLERLDPHIKCFSFNPMASILSPIINNRDHRKILVIDGYISFTGGINLADEYINEKVKFGHWKDTGVKLEGEGTWNFTVMFLNIWRTFRKDDTDVNQYKPEKFNKKVVKSIHDKGFIVAYCDNPLDNENIGLDVYMEILNQAKKYVYIFTPYLIVDHEMEYAICLAARRGVEVCIVTPGIPDKKFVYRIMRAHYLPLLKAGVKIYEYTPGFMHAKSFVSDDNIGVVGSINMDYRSLFLHFECATLMYQSDAIKELKKDCLETIGMSKEVGIQDCNSGTLRKLFDAVLRVLAPLF